MKGQNLFTYTLTKEDEGRRLEHILLRRFHFSRTLLQKIKQGENVWLDGIFTYLNTMGKAGQTLVVDIQYDEESTVEGEDLPLVILYEDDLFLAVNKPPGQVVHPNGRYTSGTLANAVAGYWEKKGESRPIRPISRIDRNTSGIVIIAKNRYAHQQIAWLSSKNQVQKKYLGIVEGQFPLENGEFSSPIRIKEGSRIVRETHEDGLPSLTRFQVLRRYKDYTLIEFTLVTGRTHQIRVHCQGSGYPLLGDDLYGGNTTYITRQALHCYTYSFFHPLTNRELRIEASLPDDMIILLSAPN